MLYSVFAVYYLKNLTLYLGIKNMDLNSYKAVELVNNALQWMIKTEMNVTNDGKNAMIV